MKPSFYRYLAVILQILVTTVTYAQSNSKQLKGKVLDERQAPLANASILLLNSKEETVSRAVTNKDGVFDFTYSKEGIYLLSISHTGYETYKAMAFALADKDFGNLHLKLANHNLKAVEIQAQQQVISLEANSIVYHVDKSISAQGTNALEVLKRAPGVFVDSDNSISLNGKSGAMILLDGKQTYLSSRELADLLKGMPSTTIKSIEIINSPSAKYDAAGTAGMINIKTIKSQLIGFNGSITSGVAYGVFIKQNQDLSFNYRKNKYNVFGNYSHLLGYYKYLYGSDREQNGNTYWSDTDDTDKRKKMNSRLGIDYNLNTKNTLGVLLTGNFIFGGGITDTETELSIPSSNAQQTLRAVNDYYYQSTERYNINLNYKYEDTLGHILNIDGDYGFYTKGAGNLQTNRYTDQDEQLIKENFYRTLNGADINLKAIKLVYTTNIGRGKFETGLKYSAIGTANDSKFLNVLPNEELLDERRSNDFEFNEKIASAYLNYKETLGKWILQGGLRMEQAISKGRLQYQHDAQRLTEAIDRKYTHLFPSVSLAFKPSKNHNLSVSYSRRIDRPAYQDLNPFVYLLDELSFWAGNPFLKPQLSNRLNLQYVFKSSTIIGLNYAHTSDFKAGITDTIDVDKIVMIPKNVGTQRNLSLTATQLVMLAKWWDLSVNATLYQLKNKVSFDAYRNFNVEQWAARLNLQQNFKLPFELKGELTAIYNSKRLAGANEVIRPNSQVDIGLQRNLWANKATLRVALTDIYKGSRTNSVQRFESFELKNYNYYEARQLRLNFTYRFADSSVKGPRSRNSALESENGRIK